MDQALIKTLLEVSAGVVIVVSGSRALSVARDGAKAAGVPVLRVRRDGSVEVDEP